MLSCLQGVGFRFDGPSLDDLFRRGGVYLVVSCHVQTVCHAHVMHRTRVGVVFQLLDQHRRAISPVSGVVVSCHVMYKTSVMHLSCIELESVWSFNCRISIVGLHPAIAGPIVREL